MQIYHSDNHNLPNKLPDWIVTLNVCICLYAWSMFCHVLPLCRVCVLFLLWTDEFGACLPLVSFLYRFSVTFGVDVSVCLSFVDFWCLRIDRLFFFIPWMASPMGVLVNRLKIGWWWVLIRFEICLSRQSSAVSFVDCIRLEIHVGVCFPQASQSSGSDLGMSFRYVYVHLCSIYRRPISLLNLSSSPDSWPLWGSRCFGPPSLHSLSYVITPCWWPWWDH